MGGRWRLKSDGAVLHYLKLPRQGPVPVFNVLELGPWWTQRAWTAESPLLLRDAAVTAFAAPRRSTFCASNTSNLMCNVPPG